MLGSSDAPLRQGHLLTRRGFDLFLMSSHKPKAQEFRNWLSDVRQVIETTGGYLLNEKARETAHADTISAAPAALTFDFTALIDGVSRTHAVRVVTPEGAPWFAGSDVREVLDIAQAGSNYRTLHADELRTANRRGQTSLVGFDWGKASRVTLVSASGLYKLIMRSDKPQARPFQDWVTREVLLSIRKHGDCAQPRGEAIPLPVAYPQVQHVGMPRGDPPICVLGADPFSAIGDYNICRRAGMAYRSRMKGYEACVQADLDGARKEFQDAADSFGKRRVKVDD